MALYLYLNAALYLFFAAWCSLRPWQTSASIGYEALSTSGKSEYLVVYGGLQFGLAALFAYTAYSPQLRETGVVIALLLYGPIVAYRLATVLKYWPVRRTTLVAAILELLLLLAGLLLWCMA